MMQVLVYWDIRSHRSRSQPPNILGLDGECEKRQNGRGPIDDAKIARNLPNAAPLSQLGFSHGFLSPPMWNRRGRVIWSIGPNRVVIPTSTAQPSSRPNLPPIMAAVDTLKPIAFCEHFQLSSLGVQPGSISFQVRWRDTTLCLAWTNNFLFPSHLH